MALDILVNISSGNGLSYRLFSTKPSYEPLLTYCLFTGDPLHSRALAHNRAPLFTQPCPHCSHSRAPGEQWARLCVFTLQDCVQAARLCRGSPVLLDFKEQISVKFESMCKNIYFKKCIRNVLCKMVSILLIPQYANTWFCIEYLCFNTEKSSWNIWIAPIFAS